MNVTISDECIGCGVCNTVCPEVFSMGDEGKAVATDEVPKSQESLVQDAVISCPVGAISADR